MNWLRYGPLIVLIIYLLMQIKREHAEEGRDVGYYTVEIFDTTYAYGPCEYCGSWQYVKMEEGRECDICGKIIVERKYFKEEEDTP